MHNKNTDPNAINLDEMFPKFSKETMKSANERDDDTVEDRFRDLKLP